MAFTDETTYFIKIMCENRYSYRKFIREFSNKNRNRRGLDYLIKKIDNFDPIAQKSESGRPPTTPHDDNIDTVADLVQSQEDRSSLSADIYVNGE